MESGNRKRNDILLIAVLLCVAFLILSCQNMFSKDGAYVVVIQGGEVIYEISLEEDLYGGDALRLESEEGYNILEIKNGKASVCEADCPDGLCVKQKSISKQGESLICLPHKLVITVEGAETSNIDAFAY